MLNITDSDIFKLQDAQGIFTEKISTILRHAMANPRGDSEIVILNGKLADSIMNMKKMYNEPMVLKAIDALRDGRILLVELSSNLNIPKCMPFVRYTMNNETKILVNITAYVDKKPNSTNEVIYSMSIQKLYPLIICAYMSLNVFDNKYILPPKALSSAAYIWASMFNKVLIKAVALGTNKERYDAFMYFAMKFFCIYICQVPEQIAEDTARAYLVKKGRKDFMLVKDMQDTIDNLQYKPYESFRSLCVALFDNRVSNLRGIAISSSAKSINEAFYLNRFVDQFTFTSLFSLATFPYFLFSIMNAAYKTRIVNDIAFQDIINDKDYNIIQLLNSLMQGN